MWNLTTIPLPAVVQSRQTEARLTRDNVDLDVCSARFWLGCWMVLKGSFQFLDLHFHISATRNLGTECPMDVPYSLGSERTK